MNTRINAGCDFGNLGNKIRISAPGSSPMNILIPSDVEKESRFTHGPYIDPDTKELSTSITVQREGSNRVIGPVIVGAAATLRNYRNITTTQGSGLKIDNIPVYMGALASAIAPKESESIVFNMACSVLDEELSADLRKIVQGSFLVNFQGRKEPLKMSFILNEDNVIPEGSACIFADVRVQNSIVIDCGHGTTIVSKRNHSIDPSPRKMFDVGMCRVIENLMGCKNVLRAANKSGQGSPRFAHIKAGILNGSLRYGGIESGFSFAADYQREIKAMVATYEELLDQVIDPNVDHKKDLFVMGGGANVPQVVEMIKKRGGSDLLSTFPEAGDHRFLNAALLHSIL